MDPHKLHGVWEFPKCNQLQKTGTNYILISQDLVLECYCFLLPRGIPWSSLSEECNFLWLSDILLLGFEGGFETGFPSWSLMAVGVLFCPFFLFLFAPSFCLFLVWIFWLWPCLLVWVGVGTLCFIDSARHLFLKKIKKFYLDKVTFQGPTKERNFHWFLEDFRYPKLEYGKKPIRFWPKPIFKF